MNIDQRASGDSSEIEVSLRKSWRKPVLARLRSGSAESMVGTTIPDATLETIGS